MTPIEWMEFVFLVALTVICVVACAVMLVTIIKGWKNN